MISNHSISINFTLNTIYPLLTTRFQDIRIFSKFLFFFDTLNSDGNMIQSGAVIFIL